MRHVRTTRKWAAVFATAAFLDACGSGDTGRRDT